jgi:thiamine biosynthesis protein ThiI
VENLNCSESPVRNHENPVPVLRPLIGIDKEEIILKAKDFGTYETSILPFADCCVLFSPPHPVLRGNPREARGLYEALELGDGNGPGLLREALVQAEVKKCGYYEPFSRSPP